MDHHQCQPPVITDSTGGGRRPPPVTYGPSRSGLYQCMEPCMSTSTHDRSANIWRQLAVLCSRAGGRPLLCALVWAQPGQSATGSHDRRPAHRGDLVLALCEVGCCLKGCQDIDKILQDGKFMVNEFTTAVQLGLGVGTDGTNTVDHAAGYYTCWHLQSPL